ncbi:hypothetical protein ABKV19_026273 [Rosa sericea]
MKGGDVAEPLSSLNHWVIEVSRRQTKHNIFGHHDLLHYQRNNVDKREALDNLDIILFPLFEGLRKE